MQDILAFGTLALAVFFAVKKFFYKKKKSNKDCGKDNCGCH